MRQHLVLATLLALMTPQLGTAGVSDYEVVTDFTVSDSSGLKSLLVDCPAGKQLLGGGARIFGSINGTGLTASGPEGTPSAPTGWFGLATEVVASSSNWGLRIDAFCGIVPGYEVVTDSTASDSTGVKSLLVDCPAGKQLLGGGARIFGTIDGTALTTSGPEGPPAAPTDWFGSATEVVASSSNWGLRIDSFCANVTGYNVVTDLTNSDSGSVKSLFVNGPGDFLVGGGSRIFGSIDGTALTTSGPEGPPAAPTDWFGSAIEDVATSANWGLRVDAIYVPEPSLAPILLAGIAMLSVAKMRRQSPPR
jgi:hypothetical protein